MFAFIPFVGLKDNFPEVDYVSKYSIIYNLYKRWLKDNKKEKEDWLMIPLRICFNLEHIVPKSTC